MKRILLFKRLKRFKNKAFKERERLYYYLQRKALKEWLMYHHTLNPLLYLMELNTIERANLYFKRLKPERTSSLLSFLKPKLKMSCFMM